MRMPESEEALLRAAITALVNAGIVEVAMNYANPGNEVGSRSSIALRGNE